MALFVKTPEFKALNVGFCLDEGTVLVCKIPFSEIFKNLICLGVAHPDDTYRVYYAERHVWCKSKFYHKSLSVWHSLSYFCGCSDNYFPIPLSCATLGFTLWRRLRFETLKLIRCPRLKDPPSSNVASC